MDSYPSTHFCVKSVRIHDYFHLCMATRHSTAVHESTSTFFHCHCDDIRWMVSHLTSSTDFILPSSQAGKHSTFKILFNLGIQPLSSRYFLSTFQYLHVDVLGITSTRRIPWTLEKTCHMCIYTIGHKILKSPYIIFVG